MNPRLVRQTRIYRLPSGQPSGPVAGPNPKCVDLADRLSEPRSQHAQICFFLFADGSVRPLNEAIDLRIYGALFTINGGEAVDDTSF